MKILLTGQPGVGKSTILAKVRDNIDLKCFGVVAEEIRDENEERVGFKSVNMDGDESTFAHIHDIDSDRRIGPFKVDVSSIDEFVVNELMKGLSDTQSLVFFDEIGRMQSFSKKFMKTLDLFLESDANMLGTIVYDPEPWSIKYKEHEDVILVEVDEENREELGEVILLVLSSLREIDNLNPKQKTCVRDLLKQYFANKNYVSIRKLFDNAINYLKEGKVKEINENEYLVDGFTKNHRVITTDGKYSCDCDYFNGKGEYAYSGECSHIQCVKLFNA